MPSSIDPQDLPPAIALLGPTASGKTAVSLALAGSLPVEIISVDSCTGLSRHGHRNRQAGGCGAGPLSSPPDRHHQPRRALFRSELPPGCVPADAGDHRAAAFRCWRAAPCCISRPCRRDSELPQADAGLRREIDREAARRGWPALHAELARLDPQARPASSPATRSVSAGARDRAPHRRTAGCQLRAP